MMSDNERCRQRAFYALQCYGIEGDEEEAVIDLLTDLRHMSEQYGWTLDECVESSLIHYEAEKDQD